MALSKETIEATEFAKSQLMNSDLDETVKKQLHNLLTVSMMATNGISVEEKIQKITECISDLVILQCTFLHTVDKKIALANKEQCKSCKAMQHTLDDEEQKEKDEIIEAWKVANGIDTTTEKAQLKVEYSDSWMDIIKLLLLKPYIWIFGAIVTISPYGVDVINALLAFFK